MQNDFLVDLIHIHGKVNTVKLYLPQVSWRMFVDSSGLPPFKWRRQLVVRIVLENRRLLCFQTIPEIGVQRCRTWFYLSTHRPTYANQVSRIRFIDKSNRKNNEYLPQNDYRTGKHFMPPENLALPRFIFQKLELPHRQVSVRISERIYLDLIFFCHYLTNIDWEIF